jgi:osmotically-inducible protein OsmY
VSDHQLEAAVMQALADNPRVHPDEIAVQAVDGKVTLRGTVGSVLQRAEAVRTARAVPGVRSVDDDLWARPLGVDGRDDADTRAAVLEALIDDDELEIAGMDVHAHDGTVTLHGTVRRASDLDRAARTAHGVGGVDHVRNELKFVQPAQ